MTVASLPHAFWVLNLFPHDYCILGPKLDPFFFSFFFFEWLDPIFQGKDERNISMSALVQGGAFSCSGP